MKLTLLLMVFIVFSSSANAQDLSKQELELAKKSIEALIRPLIPVKTKSRAQNGFRVDECDKHQSIDWREVLLLQKDITLEYKFKEGCDIQGIIKPRVFTPFPADLNLRNLQKFVRVKSENKLTSSIESRPIMILEILSGTLFDHKGKILFDGEYRVQINPLSRKDFIEKNLGGEIRIKQIYGKEVSIIQKILIE
jgi:hypothetical protein